MHTRIPGVSKRRTLSLGAGALLSFSFVVAACSVEPEPTPPAETGGSGGLSGGTSGAGGTAGTFAGSGGTPQAGTGGAGTGGLSGSGGQGGSTAGKGGSAGQGGTAGTSGAAGSFTSGAGGVATGGMGGLAGAGQGGMAGSAGSMGGNAGSQAGASMGGAASGAGGAGSSGAGTGGSGGAAGFAPCPASMPCKILPLGDSITDGIGFSGGYRVELFSLALADDHDITYVGGSMNGPQTVDGQPFPRAHEGHSGWTISQIDGIVPSPALDPDPNIILLHIGTNDMGSGGNGAPGRVETLVDAILADQPNALLVLSTIIPFPGAASAVTTFNATIPGIVSERAADGKHIIFADQFTGFPTNELGDGVHPNQAGYERMARVWYEAISDYL